MYCPRLARLVAIVLGIAIPGLLIGAPHPLAMQPGIIAGTAQAAPGKAVLPVPVQKRSVMTTRLSLPPRNPLRLPNLRLEAVLGPGGRILTEGLSWRIEKRVGKEEKSGELVWSGGGAHPELRLDPGRYYAEASFGLARNGMAFEVPDGTDRVTPVVSLDAGTLYLHGAATADGPQLEDMFFTLSKAEAGTEDEKDIGRSSLPNAVFHVPAGDYRLTAKHGLATITLPVSVKPGEERKVEAVMNTGVIKLSAHAEADAPLLSGVTFFVYENGEAGRNREILRSRLGEPEFTLPAGQYRFAAVIGLARTEKDIRIEPGKEQRQHLILNAGGVRLSSKLSGGGPALDGNLLYRIYDLSGDNSGSANREVFTSTQTSPTVFLPSGHYRLESQYGWHNARKTREIDIAAGDVTSVDFEHKAANVKLRLVQKPGGKALEQVRWTLQYNGAGTVLVSQDAEPDLILQAGDYKIVAQRDAQSYTRSFEVAANRDQVIELMAK